MCVYLSPSLNRERVPLTRCTWWLLSCRAVNENGTRSDSHEGQDEIKDRRCRSRDNDPRVLTEDDRRRDRTSIECLDKTSRLIDREEAGETRWRGEARSFSSTFVTPLCPVQMNDTNSNSETKEETKSTYCPVESSEILRVED